MAPAQAPRPERQGRLAPHGAQARRWLSSVVEAGQGSAESVENARRGKRRRGVFVTRDEKRPVTTLSAKGCAGARSTGCRKPQGFTTSLATTGPSRALPSLGRMYGIVTLRCAYSEKVPQGLFFGTRGGLVRRYERAIALPPRPRVGRARAALFFPVMLASAAVAPLNGRIRR